MGIIIALIIFLAIILLHELGHFIVAKIMGVGIVEYSIGMGPLLWSHRFGDTVFAIRLIPFGGYCAMCGEDSAEAEGKDEAKEEQNDTKANRTYLFGQPNYKTEWREDQQLRAQSPWHQILIYAAGPAMNIILGIAACLCLMGGFAALTVPTVAEIHEDTPAAISAIQEGDIIVGVNDRYVLSWDDYQEYRVSHANLMENGFTVTVDRNGTELTIPAEYNEEGIFGIEVDLTEVEKTPISILVYTGNEVRYMIHSVTDSFYMLTHGSASMDDLTGIIGMTAIVSDSVAEAEEAENGSIMITFLFLLAMLSINLGLLNLLPIPALDGGRIVLSIIEIIRHKPVPEKVEWAINEIGMILLVMLMCYVMFNDVFKIISGSI